MKRGERGRENPEKGSASPWYWITVISIVDPIWEGGKGEKGSASPWYWITVISNFERGLVYTI